MLPVEDFVVLEPVEDFVPVVLVGLVPLSTLAEEVEIEVTGGG